MCLTDLQMNFKKLYNLIDKETQMKKPKAMRNFKLYM